VIRAQAPRDLTALGIDRPFARMEAARRFFRVLEARAAEQGERAMRRAAVLMSVVDECWAYIARHNTQWVPADEVSALIDFYAQARR
jgi:hypothetical protein